MGPVTAVTMFLPVVLFLATVFLLMRNLVNRDKRRTSLFTAAAFLVLAFLLLTFLSVASGHPFWHLRHHRSSASPPVPVTLLIVTHP
jgi:4-amino-4-deoxy-L-arabinose transferase-like glycosyltransferase